MPLYRCSKCGCVENTALGNYWIDQRDRKPALCSECNPAIGKWHGEFEKASADSYATDERGFLRSKGGR